MKRTNYGLSDWLDQEWAALWPTTVCLDRMAAQNAAMEFRRRFRKRAKKEFNRELDAAFASRYPWRGWIKHD